MDLTNPITLGLCGIGFLFVVFFVVGLIQAAGRPNIDGDLSHLPGSVADKLVSLTNQVAKANLFHELLGKVFGWLSHAEVPHVTPDQRQGGLVMGIITLMACSILVFAGAASGFFGKIVNLFPKTLVVQEGQICTGIRNGQTVQLLPGTELITNQDVCDGALVQAATQIPAPTTAPTLTGLTQVPAEVIPVDVVPSAMPTFIPASPIPSTEEARVYIVMKFTMSPDGSIALLDGRFDEGSLDGYMKVGETQECKLFNMPSFNIPTGYSEGLIYFEGLDNYQRPSGANVAGATISFNNCTPTGTNFSLYLR